MLIDMPWRLTQWRKESPIEQTLCHPPRPLALTDPCRLGTPQSASATIAQSSSLPIIALMLCFPNSPLDDGVRYQLPGPVPGNTASSVGRRCRVSLHLHAVPNCLRPHGHDLWVLHEDRVSGTSSSILCCCISLIASAMM
ncbi:MAG: hypothetical protein Ct9H300mP30_3920 [Methanobacteriota archaeon]|nr:MAG: hypothetical protein Ct9H300mP30_3920 [Euryarchaeota archaeon]